MIHVVARSKIHGEVFLANHPQLLNEIKVEVGQRSYFTLLNELIMSEHAYACVVHDDVLLCSDFFARLQSLIETLDHDWPNWGLAGNAGLLTMRVGYSSTDIVRYISDPHGGPNLGGYILPAQTIDGNVMLLNLRALREANVTLPSFDGFQLYDIILSIETVAAGLGVYVAPQLACWHGSKGNQDDFDRAKLTDAFHNYLRKRVKNRYIQTLNGVATIRSNGLDPLDRPGIDIDIENLRAATGRRPTKSVAIVTRTQFKRNDLLRRTLETVSAFIASAGSSTQFKSYVVTDSEPTSRASVAHLATILRADLSSGGDTRYKLVQFAAENIEADYFWFIDDDDWLLPNEAERLALIVNAAPLSSLIFVDSQHFFERLVPTNQPKPASAYRSTEGPYFKADRFLASLSGQNHTPFCGALLNRTALLAIPNNIYDTVTYYEDYMTILITLLSSKCLPIVVDKLYVGISLRESGNTVTELDRSKWNKSMSEVVSHLVTAPSTSLMLSLYPHISSIASEAELSSLRAEVQSQRQLLDQVTQSRSWRLTYPLRLAGRYLRNRTF